MTGPSSSAEDIACRTKARYDTHAAAKRHWKWLRRQPGRRHLQIYECTFCGLFHMGNPPGRQTYTRAGSPPLSPRRATAA